MWQFILTALEPETNISFGRTISLLVTLFVLGWDTAHLIFAWHFNYHLLPGAGVISILPDAGVLAAQAGFMTVFYGVAKYGEARAADATATVDVAKATKPSTTVAVVSPPPSP